MIVAFGNIYTPRRSCDASAEGVKADGVMIPNGPRRRVTASQSLLRRLYLFVGEPRTETQQTDDLINRERCNWPMGDVLMVGLCRQLHSAFSL